MKKVIGILMIVAGVALGIYAGVWWAFVGGIVDVIGAIRAPEFVGGDVAIGVVKVIFAGLIGYLPVVALSWPGLRLMLRK